MINLSLGRYDIVNTNKENETRTVGVEQKACNLEFKNRIKALEAVMRGNPLVNHIESLNEKEAQDALVAVDKELQRREGDTSSSWTWNWLNSPSSESSWGWGLWNWMSSFISNLGNYSTETLQATRESLSRRLTSNNNTNSINNTNG